MLPDPGRYEERYRLAVGAAPGLAIALMTIGLVFLTVWPWVTGVVIAVALVILMGAVVTGRRRVAFRADYAGVTLGVVPGKLTARGGPAVPIPWADVEKIILYPASPAAQGADARVQCIGVQRRQGAAALPAGNEQAPGCPVPGVAAGATRRVAGWRLDRERLAVVTAAVAPGIPVVDASTGPGLGIDGQGQGATALEPGPADLKDPERSGASRQARSAKRRGSSRAHLVAGLPRGSVRRRCCPSRVAHRSSAVRPVSCRAVWYLAGRPAAGRVARRPQY